MVKDKHVIEALGVTRVTIENGSVTNVEGGIIDNCPVFEKGHGIKKLTHENVKKNIEFRIKKFGYCTKDRVVTQEDTLVAVGVSEIISTNMKLGNIDCVVGACDGVGTLIMTDPQIVQGVGGRVSGLVSTTPIPEVIEKVGVDNVLNPKTAEMNPLKGLEKALNLGYKNIAVTITPSHVARQIKEYSMNDDVNKYLFIVHTTGITEELSREMFEVGDILTACASRYDRKIAEELKPYYYGNSVPIYATSDNGRKFLDNRLDAINKPRSVNDYPQDYSNFPTPLR